MLKVGGGYKGKYPLVAKTPDLGKYLVSEPAQGKRSLLAKRLNACYRAAPSAES